MKASNRGNGGLFLLLLPAVNLAIGVMHYGSMRGKAVAKNERGFQDTV